MLKNKAISLLVAIILTAQLFMGHVSNAANSYTGTWSDQYEIGSYGLNQMDLNMKEKGKKIEVEVANTHYLPINDSRGSFLEATGRYRSSVITGTVIFNSTGKASFSYKDKYNNGQMTISVKNETVIITWSGKENSDYSFPKGTFKLKKKVALSPSESKKMGVFLSNFTELQLYKFDSEKVNNSELIRFGIWHNYINNFSSRIGSVNGKLYISKSYVEASILKYFSIKFKDHRTTQNFKYNGRGYTFEGSDGERIYYVQIDGVYDLGSNNYRIHGHLYDADSGEEVVSRVSATVKKIKSGNGYNYALKKMNVKY
ncbi:hypothetical protein [Paenibacillus sp. 2003]|uniref:hypothetical protein n=1 Tax=Paenibacillus sp. 2003 TaxID=2817761 RepID=UPI00285FFD8D|nr:hypothetical protein [Paenibacillus sp. 2003]MDR6720889.1 hypothetical protein [Paenibacillus sp. 2003]